MSPQVSAPADAYAQPSCPAKGPHSACLAQVQSPRPATSPGGALPGHVPSAGSPTRHDPRPARSRHPSDSSAAPALPSAAAAGGGAAGGGGGGGGHPEAYTSPAAVSGGEGGERGPIAAYMPAAAVDRSDDGGGEDAGYGPDGWAGDPTAAAWRHAAGDGVAGAQIGDGGGGGSGGGWSPRQWETEMRSRSPGRANGLGGTRNLADYYQRTIQGQ